MKKCFDTVDAFQAIELWKCWGAPRGVARVLGEFYERHERWVECRGAVATRPIKPVRALLQGCPASALLLAAIMSVWVVAVKKRVPDINVGGFLDDRILWTRDKGSGGGRAGQA